MSRSFARRPYDDPLLSASQRDSVSEARANLAEAVELFLATASEEEIAKRYHREVYVTRLDVRAG